MLADSMSQISKDLPHPVSNLLLNRL